MNSCEKKKYQRRKLSGNIITWLGFVAVCFLFCEILPNPATPELSKGIYLILSSNIRIFFPLWNCLMISLYPVIVWWICKKGDDYA